MKKFISKLFLESKWKKLVAAGKLGKGSLRRVQKAKLPKSRKDYMAGVDKGTKGIMKKHGAKVQHKPDQVFATAQGMEKGKSVKDIMLSHGTVSGKKKRIHVPKSKDIKPKERELSKIVKRHEADEISQGSRQLKKHRTVANASIAGAGQTAHMSDKVLNNEKKLRNTADALYGKKGGRGKLNKIRKKTGEDKAIAKMKTKDISKRDKQTVKAVKTQTSAAVKAGKKQLKQMSPEARKKDMSLSNKMLKSMGINRRARKATLNQYN